MDLLLRKALFLGGMGAVGRLMAGLLRAAGAAITVVDVQQRAGLDATDLFLCQDLDQPLQAAVETALRESDVVVVTLPEAIALRVAASVLPLLRSDALWVDTLSVKAEICGLLATHASPAERVSINPMFAPALGWAGQRVAWVAVSSGPLAAELAALIHAAGAKTVPVSADAHDRLTAVTQVATHAAILAYGLAMREIGCDAELLWQLSTPPNRILTAMLARIVNGNPEVYWDIQRHHAQAGMVREGLRTGVAELDAMAKADAEDAFVAALGGVREALQPLQSELGELGDILVQSSRIKH